jgi:hypothetical protein
VSQIEQVMNGDTLSAALDVGDRRTGEPAARSLSHLVLREPQRAPFGRNTSAYGTIKCRIARIVCGRRHAIIVCAAHANVKDGHNLVC